MEFLILQVEQKKVKILKYEKGSIYLFVRTHWLVITERFHKNGHSFFLWIPILHTYS